MKTKLSSRENVTAVEVGKAKDMVKRFMMYPSGFFVLYTLYSSISKISHTLSLPPSLCFLLPNINFSYSLYLLCMQ